MRMLVVSAFAVVGCSNPSSQPLGGRVGGVEESQTAKVAFGPETKALVLPFGASKFEIDGMTTSGSGQNFMWSGNTKRGETVHFVRRGSHQVGVILAADGMYRVEKGLDGTLKVTKIEQTPGKKHHNEGQKHGSPLQVLEADGDITILGVYTSTAAANCKAIVADILLGIEVTNTVMENSLIPTRFKHVETFELVGSFNERHYSMENIVANLTDQTKEDFLQIHERREVSKADLVVLFTASEDGIDGASAQTTADEDTAFAVVRCDRILRNYGFVHEIGHLMGLNDDSDIAAQSTYQEGFGHSHEDANGGWRTIMSSGVECSGTCDRIPYLSNPKVNYNGTPTGVVGTSDNAAVLAKTSGAISRFF